MSGSEKRPEEVSWADTITLRAGEITAAAELLRPAPGQKLISGNAYVASVLQTGKVIGNDPGETELWVEENHRPVRKVHCVVKDGKRSFPILLNRFNGISGPAGRLVPLTQEFGGDQYTLEAEENTAKAFSAMYDEAKIQNVWLCIAAGYRSIQRQESIIQRYIQQEGEELAMKRCAPAGFSEHHSGLALDVNGGVFQNGEPVRNNEAAWKWLAERCHEFGFMIKNLPGKEHITGTRHEPWHIRYLGDLQLCRYLHDNRLTLDEYLDHHAADIARAGRNMA